MQVRGYLVTKCRPVSVPSTMSVEYDIASYVSWLPPTSFVHGGIAGAVVVCGINVYDSLTSIDIRISESTTSRTGPAGDWRLATGSKVGLSLAIAYESSLYLLAEHCVNVP